MSLHSLLDLAVNEGIYADYVNKLKSASSTKLVLYFLIQ